jgi:site-specific DNA-methyltransferase (adenine-specific)
VPWNKTEGVRPVMGRFRAQCEYAVFASAGAMPQREDVGVLPGFFTVPVRQADKFHQTGKPTDLMRAICRVVPPGGIVLDPFCGSASTGVGALMEGRRFIGCEKVAEYVAISRERLAAAEAGPADMFSGAA